MANSPLTADEIKALRKTTRLARVVVIGSLNMDQVLEVDGVPEDDSTLMIRSDTTQFGGHAGNCAAALAQLGLSVTIVAAVGLDDDGEKLINDLMARGINTKHIHRSQTQASGHVIIPLFRDRHFMLMSRGANESLVAADVEKIVNDDIDAVVMLDPTESVAIAISAQIAQLPSCRSFWNPGGMLVHSDLVPRLAKKWDAIIVNRQEYDVIGQAILNQIATHPKTDLVTTLGAEGAMLRMGDGVWVKVAAAKVHPIDPTGAGDTFTAAYVLCSLAQLAPAQCLRLATIAGALATTALGARGRLPRLDDLIDIAAH